jgi:predicted nucleotidyltransferase
MKLDRVSSTDLRNFLELLINAAESKFSGELVSIALFGSATTEEWVRGRSDIDFIVVVRRRDSRRSVEDYLNRLLLELDQNLGLGLRDSCSTYRQRRNPILRLVDRIEDWFTFGRPFYVLSLDQLNFDKGTIDDLRIKVMSLMFNSLSIFAAKIKMTGATVYGEDLIQKLTLAPSRSDKVKAAMAPLWILLISFVTLSFDPAFSMQHAVKATVWACEDVLFALDEPLSSTKEEFAKVQSLFRRSGWIDFDHLDRTLSYKQNWPSVKHSVTLWRALNYNCDSVRFVYTLYLSALRSCFLHPAQSIRHVVWRGRQRMSRSFVSDQK